MGAWGYGPYDNDTAADWFFGLTDTKLYDFIDKGLSSKSCDEQRAAAWLVQRLAVSAFVYDVNLIDSHVKCAIDKLEIMLADNDWLDQWRDRAQIINEIKAQRDELKKLRK